MPRMETVARGSITEDSIPTVTMYGIDVRCGCCECVNTVGQLNAICARRML